MTDTNNLEVVNIDVQRGKQEMATAEPRTIQPELHMENLIPESSSFDQVSAKDYLQQNVFPKLEIALNNVSIFLISLYIFICFAQQLLETIEKNGEFQRFVVMLTDREEKEHRQLRRRERERKRLQEGDAYASDNDSEDWKDDAEDDDFDDETSEYGSEAQSEMLDGAAGVSDIVGADGRSSVQTKKRKGTSSKVSDGMDIQHRFNALRFLAMNMKSQNGTMKPRTADTPGSSQGRHNLAAGAMY